MWFATQGGTIASTVTAVGAAAGVTPILVEPTHSLSDPQQCNWANAGNLVAGEGCSPTMPSNAQISDFRYGDYQTGANIWGLNPASNYTPWHRWRSVYTTNNGVAGQHLTPFSAEAVYLNGGININQNGYTNLPWQAVQENRALSYTPGNTFPLVTWGYKYSTGDILAYYGNLLCYGGFSAGSGEGCEGIDIGAVQGTVEYTGTVSSSTSSTVSVGSVSFGEGTQGAGRYLVDQTQAITGNATAITAPAGGSYFTVTDSGASFPVSSVNTTLGTAVTAPGSATVTPASATGISTSDILCVGGTKTGFEQIKVTGTGSGTFTAVYRYPHLTTDFVVKGGLCGYYWSFVADDATHAVYSEIGSSNPLHWVVPVVRSLSSTTFEVWLTHPDNGIQGYTGNWSVGTPGYRLWPGAEVISVMTPGGQTLSDTLTLEPQQFTWTNGDTVSMPHYWALAVHQGQLYRRSYFPNTAGESGFFTLYSSGLMHGSDSLVFLQNNTPSAYYTTSGTFNYLNYPRMFNIDKNFGYYFWTTDYPHAAFFASYQTATAFHFIEQPYTGGTCGTTCNSFFDSDPVNHWYKIYRFGSTNSITLDWDGGIVNATAVQVAGQNAVTQDASGNVNINGSLSNPTGVLGGWQNLALYSQFDAAQLPATGATWAYQCDHGTFTANTSDVTDPLGGNTALKAVMAASGNTCGAGYPITGIEQTISGLAASTQYTMSVWARSSAGGEILNAGIGGGATCGYPAQSTMPLLTTSWQRFSCTVTMQGVRVERCDRVGGE